MKDIRLVHNKLFELFYEHWELNPNFLFRPRRTNRYNKLEEGFWFLGNQNYLAIAFWEGNDWKTRLPNISFMSDPTGRCWLHFSASDDLNNAQFLYDIVFQSIGLEVNEKDYRKRNYRINHEFKSKGVQDCVFEFLTKYWPIINICIENQKDKTKSEISLLEPETTLRDIRKIVRYKERIDVFNMQAAEINAKRIHGFSIWNYGSIQEAHLHSIPPKSQWIFLTGENGVGKSSVLKALASTIAHRRISDMEMTPAKEFVCTIHTNSDTSSGLHINRKGNQNVLRRIPYTKGFAAYGPIRLNTIYGGMSSKELKAAKAKTSSLKSLFDNDGFLLDLQDQFKEWVKTNEKEFDFRKEAIKEFFQGLLINVRRVEFKYDFEGRPVTLIQEEDDNGNLYDPLGVEKLSSGYLSLLAMMGDMIIRLFQQQPKIYDMGELEGVVLIDEIDIHLHPKFQKHFVEQLTATFPKIQFIVTTHSPIPLLGAPKNSVICVVKRDRQRGTYIDRVDDQLLLENMLPNSILSSPIFGFKELFPISHDEDKKIRTEDSFEEIKKNDELKAYLRSIAQNLKSEE